MSTDTKPLLLQRLQIFENKDLLVFKSSLALAGLSKGDDCERNISRPKLQLYENDRK